MIITMFHLTKRRVLQSNQTQTNQYPSLFVPRGLVIFLFQIKMFKNYSVVEFTEDTPTTVEAIPSGWLSGKTECFWPLNLKQNRLTKLLKDGSSRPDKSWAKCKCRILYSYGKLSYFVKA